MSDLQPLLFEHLVQINDASNPLIEPISRLQLWQGLVLRAEQPKVFMPWLDRFELMPQEDGTLERLLHFGEFIVHDRISFQSTQSVIFEILNGADGLESKMVMSIEEPTADALFVRFTYRVLSENHHDESPLKGAITEAYRHADQDTVFRIRQLVDSGVLE